MAMAGAPNDEVIVHLEPFIRVYKSGRVERLSGTEVVPASVDPVTGIISKDVVISPETGLSARLYLPNNPQKKLPLLIYYHGGSFCVETAFSPTYQNYLNSLVSQAKMVVVSVNYRRAPEDPVPTAHGDSWLALQWAASHARGRPEAWLADHADFGQVYLAGDSAGANIAHQMAMRAGDRGLEDGVKIKIKGVVLVHPYFWGTKPVGSETAEEAIREYWEKMWEVVCWGKLGNDDPLINPLAVEAPSLSGLGCEHALVCVAGEDTFRERGRAYYEKLGESGWGGEVELFESVGVGHVFHLLDQNSEKALALMERVVAFLRSN